MIIIEDEQISPKKPHSKKKNKDSHKFDFTEIEEQDDDSPIKKIEFKGVLGEGAFGKVFSGKNLKNQEPCAIKAIIYVFIEVTTSFS